ncbi:RloB family protein [Amycolatopsis roodepoortensis]|uniref:RloB family protein n=1 Tax=Amycolatopsis roodepoortensis TaxID=700274 RepID=UPI00353095BD
MSQRGHSSPRAKWRAPHGSRKERARILVVTEGLVTEPQYFKGLAKHFKATGVRVCGLKVIGDGRGDPLKVVKRADLETNNGHLVGKRDGFDSVWCVVDVDTHVSLGDAIIEAKRRNYNIVVSNPCFEIWLVWHFGEHRAYLTSRHAEKISEKHGILEKRLPYDFPYGDVTLAIERSQRIETEIPSNPGSTAWKLAKVISQL